MLHLNQLEQRQRARPLTLSEHAAGPPPAHHIASHCHTLDPTHLGAWLAASAGGGVPCSTYEQAAIWGGLSTRKPGSRRAHMGTVGAEWGLAAGRHIVPGTMNSARIWLQCAEARSRNQACMGCIAVNLTWPVRGEHSSMFYAAKSYLGSRQGMHGVHQALACAARPTQYTAQTRLSKQPSRLTCCCEACETRGVGA